MKKLAFFAFLAAGCMAADTPPDTPDAGGGGVTATFTSLYGDYLSNCARCHSPAGPGRTSDIEKTLDFSTKMMAYTTIKTGTASGLSGNFAGCNGVAFVNTDPSKSLLLASLDQTTRMSFDASATCGQDDVSDQTLKVGSDPSPAFIAALKTWMQAGSPNN